MERLSRISRQAVTELLRFVKDQGGLEAVERSALLDFCYALATRYGEASAALSAAWYDELAAAMGKTLPPAIVAPTATYSEVAKTVNGVLKISQNEDMVGGAVERLVKIPGADTMLNNAIRDGAQVAWIPRGDTCAFCLTLASNGWRRASRDLVQNGHAEHIHAHCDCTYAVRYDDVTDVAGYNNGARYRRMYEEAPLDHWNTADGEPPPGNTTDEESLRRQRINAMRRVFYAEHREEIRAQQDSAYEQRKELESSGAEEAQA